MEENNNLEQKSQLGEILAGNDIDKIIVALGEFPPAIAIDVFMDMSIVDVFKYLNLLSEEEAGRLFSHFSTEKCYELFQVADKRTFSNFFTHMYSDTRADLYQEFTKEEKF